jgi:hypothetical protein
MIPLRGSIDPVHAFNRAAAVLLRSLEPMRAWGLLNVCRKPDDRDGADTDRQCAYIFGPDRHQVRQDRS